MKRREILGLGATGMAALAAGPALARQQGQGHRHDPIHEECLKACSDCVRMCNETFHHCYTQVAEGKKEHALSMHLLSDCAGFCELSACTIARHSPLMAQSCAACAEACRMTATEVEKFHSEEMRAAAKSLRTCEESCRKMVAAMGGHHHGDEGKTTTTTTTTRSR